MEIKNAVIEDVDIAIQRLASQEPALVIRLLFDTDEQSNPAITVKLPDNDAGYWLREFLYIADSTSGLFRAIGKAVRLMRSDSGIKIGHIVKDVWFNPYDFKKDSAAERGENN